MFEHKYTTGVCRIIVMPFATSRNWGREKDKLGITKERYSASSCQFKPKLVQMPWTVWNNFFIQVLFCRTLDGFCKGLLQLSTEHDRDRLHKKTDAQILLWMLDTWLGFFLCSCFDKLLCAKLESQTNCDERQAPTSLG